jgi:hypothetical protein
MRGVTEDYMARLHSASRALLVKQNQPMVLASSCATAENSSLQRQGNTADGW